LILSWALQQCSATALPVIMLRDIGRGKVYNNRNDFLKSHRVITQQWHAKSTDQIRLPIPVEDYSSSVCIDTVAQPVGW